MHKDNNQILVTEHSYTPALHFVSVYLNPVTKIFRNCVLGTSWAKASVSDARRIEIRLRFGVQLLLQAALKHTAPQLS